MQRTTDVLSAVDVLVSHRSSCYIDALLYEWQNCEDDQYIKRPLQIIYSAYVWITLANKAPQFLLVSVACLYSNSPCATHYGVAAVQSTRAEFGIQVVKATRRSLNTVTITVIALELLQLRRTEEPCL
jgi:hypothetical protein